MFLSLVTSKSAMNVHDENFCQKPTSLNIKVSDDQPEMNSLLKTSRQNVDVVTCSFQQKTILVLKENGNKKLQKPSCWWTRDHWIIVKWSFQKKNLHPLFSLLSENTLLKNFRLTLESKFDRYMTQCFPPNLYKVYIRRSKNGLWDEKWDHGKQVKFWNDLQNSDSLINSHCKTSWFRNWTCTGWLKIPILSTPFSLFLCSERFMSFQDLLQDSSCKLERTKANRKRKSKLNES